MRQEISEVPKVLTKFSCCTRRLEWRRRDDAEPGQSGSPAVENAWPSPSGCAMWETVTEWLLVIFTKYVCGSIYLCI
ncbi:MAG: hypothetical protein UV28_C0041G0007 [Candidatus Collierbacteria bacterium GW2011_GWE2_42_48]|nr:MAG: hypothetical protein UV28_C0041G0007 [Candidatus Collierbacteria bacterium GW2011_GWE2_42_48]